MGTFCISPIFGGDCSDNSRLEHCKRYLSFMDQKHHHHHPFPTVCNNLAQKSLDQRFPGRSDVRINSNAVNSSVLVIVNFSGNSLQLG